MSKSSLIIARVCPAAALILAAAVHLSCATPPPVIEEGLPPALFFQRAQEEVDNYRYDNALVYYTVLLERFPDDLPNTMAARYEIAFIHYKKGDYDRAVELFNDLLARYRGLDNPLAAPLWPRVLAERLLAIIAERRPAAD